MCVAYLDSRPFAPLDWVVEASRGALPRNFWVSLVFVRACTHVYWVWRVFVMMSECAVIIIT